MSMGKQSELKPVTEADKKMSKRHLKHRAEVEKIKDKIQKKRLSDKYNGSHAVEHLRSMDPKERHKILKKIIKSHG